MCQTDIINKGFLIQIMFELKNLHVLQLGWPAITF